MDAKDKFDCPDSDVISESRRRLIMLEAEHDIAAWNATPLTDEEQSLAAVADWGPAEDWSDWSDNRKS